MSVEKITKVDDQWTVKTPQLGVARYGLNEYTISVWMRFPDTDVGKVITKGR